jgi:hypothetical protein
VEEAFCCFDASEDGYLEREEVEQALTTTSTPGRCVCVCVCVCVGVGVGVGGCGCVWVANHSVRFCRAGAGGVLFVLVARVGCGVGGIAL